ncbi:Na+/melibiose symporter [Phyllobacterium sp. YR620]|uniref:MFS transporter n=1 Tax=Phyllobacterium sp. YR620 TaxID=1881066 RepID=UPI000880EF69|nr:MFS transporter [Phyllobacterium sp. YR620]SDO88209.1 Na+/melibiose symporter [Phyllobacterium sp. YR620]
MTNSLRPLALGRYIAYALPAIPIAALTLPLYIIVPTFYSEVTGISLATLGSVLLLIRLFDAASDPVIGWFSDRYTPAFGRRRSLFVLSIPVTATAALMVFWPPTDAGVYYLFGWGIVLSVGHTATILPYTAWGAELATDYKGRSTVAAFRESATLAGTLLAIVLPFAVGLDPTLTFHGLAAVGVVVAVLLPVAGLIAVWCVAEPRNRSTRSVTLMQGVQALIGNHAFLRLLLAFVLNGLANAIPATLFLYFVSDRLDAPTMRGPLLFLYFVCGIVGVPLAAWAAGIVGKHRAWCYAMGFACLVFAFSGFLDRGDVGPFAIICGLTGLLLGFDLALPASIQADVVDIDTATSGSQRTGIYFAAWSLATKFSLALAVGLVFPILQWSGFNAQAQGQSGAFALDVLSMLYAWLPIAFKLAAIGIMWNFPLDEAAQHKLRQNIERSQKSRSSSKTERFAYPHVSE